MNFTFILSLKSNCFIIPIAGDIQKLCYYIMQSIYYWTKDKYTFKCKKIFMWHMCFFKQHVQLGFFSVLCVGMRDVCVCVSVFLILLNQPPYLKFHKKIFTTNWSQIWMLFQDLIKYVLSFNTILTQFLEKWNKNYKKTKQKLFESLIELYSLCVS